MTSDDPNKIHEIHLRQVAEVQLANTAIPGGLTRSAEELLHELQVHQIELEMQNEALRIAQIALEESRDRYVDLYEFAPVGYLTLTPEGMIAEINLTGVTQLGRERKLLLKKSMRALVVAEDQDRWVRHFMDVKKQNVRMRVELMMQRGDGAVFQAQLDCVNSKSSVRISLLDITQQKLAEDELRIVAAAFSSQNGMVITDSRGVIQRVNQAFTHLTGYSPEEAVGQTPALLNSGRQTPTFYQKMWSTLKSQGYWQGEIWNKRKNGQIYPGILTITAINSSDHHVKHFVGNFTDITENKAAEAEIQRLAYYDLLTQLPNRRLLQDRLRQAIAATALSRMYGSIFFIDLDHFKALNDSRGHDVGDLLLVEVARRLREVIREKDMVSRQGGDEFVVLMEELGTTVNEAIAYAELLGEKLRTALNQSFNLNGYEYHCMSSIGVSLFQAQDSVKVLFKQADLALYQAKKDGRNKMRFFIPAMQEVIDRRHMLESALQKALELHQLSLYYQPQVDSSRRVIGVEALLRWQHPQFGLMLPDDFIPLAEDSGLILTIGRWVLETASAQLKKWEKNDWTCNLQIAVNVSAQQFRQPDFVMQVEGALVASGAKPTCLKLELTESMMLEDINDTIIKMQAIKKLGVLFSIDDFGTGYSSLSHLAQLPLDQIKIDKSFVRNLPGGEKEVTIARAIITMGLGLNLNVIAEGVETDNQRECLDANGCHEYQGYLFSRPLPLQEFEAFLQA